MLQVSAGRAYWFKTCCREIPDLLEKYTQGNIIVFVSDSPNGFKLAITTPLLCHHDSAHEEVFQSSCVYKAMLHSIYEKSKGSQVRSTGLDEDPPEYFVLLLMGHGGSHVPVRWIFLRKIRRVGTALQKYPCALDLPTEDPPRGDSSPLRTNVLLRCPHAADLS